jgi:hypothetical protein
VVEAASTFAIMGSGHSTTDTPYTSPGEERFSKLPETGEGRKIVGSVTGVQAFGISEDRAAIAQSGKSAVNHKHISRQAPTHAQAAQVLQISDPYLSAIQDTNVRPPNHSFPSNQPVLHDFSTQTSHANSTDLGSTLNKQSGHSITTRHINVVAPRACLDNVAILETPSKDAATGSDKHSTPPGVVCSERIPNTPNTGLLRIRPPTTSTIYGGEHEQTGAFVRLYLGNPIMSYTTPYSHVMPSQSATRMSNVATSFPKPQEPIDDVWTAGARHYIVSTRLTRQLAEINELTIDHRKKFRKLRIIFDEKMRQSDEWYRREQKSEEQIKRLAQENE